MSNIVELSDYSKRLIFLYALLTPLFFIFQPIDFNYGFTARNLLPTAVTLSISLTVFFTFLFLKETKKSKLATSGIGFAFLYGLIFALPEEILFRGLIQGFLANYYSSTGLVIFLSALIFGAAHLPNGAKGIKPRDWNWTLSLGTFLAGIPLGLTFALTDSLLFPTALHTFCLACLILFR